MIEINLLSAFIGWVVGVLSGLLFIAICVIFGND